MAGERPVLIVGAGPVGLTAAAFLAHFGTPVRIIDTNAAPTNLSKALVLWRRSIMTLDPIVPREHWLDIGCSVKGAYFGDEGAALHRIDVGNPTNILDDVQQREGQVRALPPGCMITQAGVEAALVDALHKKFGVSVQRNTQLADFSVSDDSRYVSCTLQTTHPDGQTQQQRLEASHLIACDGGRSTIRKRLGVGFHGTTVLDQRWLLADVAFEVQDGINPNKPQQEAERVPPVDAFCFYTTAAGSLGLLPISGRKGVVRILWDAGASGPTEPSLDDFQKALMEHTRLQIKLTEVIWISIFNINERQVEQYVHGGGRVLLAGDAAHVHSPAGGQGMNTGIQDAANLAWKVALVAAGEAAAGSQLLDTYHEERWPVGAMVIRNTGIILRSNAGALMRNYYVRMLRLLALRVAMSVPFIRQNMASSLAEDNIAYPNSSLAQAQAVAASGTTTSNSSSSSSTPPKTACAAAKAVWGTCKPGYSFPNATVMINGDPKPASDLLRLPVGCFGTLVLLSPSDSTAAVAARAPAGSAADVSPQAAPAEEPKWPTKWGHWPLNVVRVGGQQSASGEGLNVGSGLIASDKWGLLRAAVGGGSSTVGVLVRPDAIVAAVGGPQVISAWLDKHVVVNNSLLN